MKESPPKGMNYKDFLQSLKQGMVYGAYLFDGTEENIKSSTLAAVRKAILPEGLEELNESVMDDPETDALIAASETLPFLADKRMVLVRDLSSLTGRSDTDDRLCEYMAHVPTSTILIFYVRGKADGRKKLYTAIKKHGHIVSFDRLGDEELNRWILQTFAALGKQCAPATASLLAFTVGNDTGLLKTEIEKLAAHAGAAEQITDEAVRTLATRSMECTVFDMVDAVVAGQQGRAFRLMQDMLVMGQDRLGILAMLLRQYRLLQHVKVMQYEKKSPQDIQQNLGVPRFAANRCIQQAKGYTGGQVRRAVDICLQTEYAVKSGRINQDGALESAMLQIFALKAKA